LEIGEPPLGQNIGGATPAGAHAIARRPSVVPSGAGAGHRITDPEKMGRFSEASQD